MPLANSYLMDAKRLEEQSAVRGTFRALAASL